MIVQQLHSLEEPSLRDFRDIRTKQIVKNREICIVTGAQSVRRLLESRFKIETIVLTPELFQEWERDLLERLNSDARVWIAQKSAMETVTQFALTQGVMAAARFPPSQDLSEFLKAPESMIDSLAGRDARPPNEWMIAVLDHVNHAVNIGSIVRSCVAFGIRALLFAGESNDPFSPRAIAASTGAVFHLPVYQVPDLPNSLATIRDQHRVKLVAAQQSTGKLIDQFDFSGKVCLIFGNEHEGISRSVQALRPDYVSIPIHDAVDSLNVATAAGIVLYCASRKRT